MASHPGKVQRNVAHATWAALRATPMVAARVVIWGMGSMTPSVPHAQSGRIPWGEPACARRVNVGRTQLRRKPPVRRVIQVARCVPKVRTTARRVNPVSATRTRAVPHVKRVGRLPEEQLPAPNVRRVRMLQLTHLGAQTAVPSSGLSLGQPAVSTA
jgi:hypothetical protein